MTHEVFCLTENKIVFTGGYLECKNWTKKHGETNKWLRSAGVYPYDYPSATAETERRSNGTI